MVTIKLDMDVGEAAFVVDGEELPYKVRNILGTSPTFPPCLPYFSPTQVNRSGHPLWLGFRYIRTDEINPGSPPLRLP